MTESRYYVHDRAKAEAQGLGRSYGPLNPRYLVVDRTTGKPVDEATTARAARDAASGWNAGAYYEVRLCEWYARCGRVAAWLVTHPVLGEVPTCTRCVEKHAMQDRARPIDGKPEPEPCSYPAEHAEHVALNGECPWCGGTR